MLLENLDTAVGIRDKETNFQQASCALDAGAKIYASRVDNVHSNALKVLGGLGRTEQIDEGSSCRYNHTCVIGYSFFNSR